MPKIKHLSVRGGASGKILKSLTITENEMQQVLMYYLQSHGIPIASSCNGEGVCLKCKIQWHGHTIISCQLKLGDLFHNSFDTELVISYL
jgi:ferredoxin